MKPVFMGLDGEMSGCDPDVHKLIQFGLAMSESDQVGFMIGWDECACDAEALAISGITYEQILDAPRAQEVDAKLIGWCQERDIQPNSIIPVGWAVSTFDLPFVRNALPRFSGFLHHHCIELNAVCYTMAGTIPYLEVFPDRANWKDMALKIAEQRLALLGMPPEWHDAAYDATASIVAWNWMRAILRSGSQVVDRPTSAEAT